MAVTSIWAVTTHYERAIEYVMNPEKTIEKPELSPEAIAARKAVGDVIDYASNGDKTEQMMYVTGINCNPKDAANEFMETKLMWNKTGGRLAYHGYQAFLEGDGKISAQTAHEIGVRLAQEVWGDRFEVVVATHLNTDHYHSHFVINSVSFRDGYKYRRTKADYWKMRLVNDKLCKEYGLHIVVDPFGKSGRTFDEWQAERQGRMTVRGTIREDIDYAIRLSRSEEEFARTMKELGYEFKFFQKDGTPLEHPGLKPPGAKGYFRFRGLGPDYDYLSIRRRIIENTLVPNTPFLIEQEDKRFREDQPKENGLPFAYRSYCIRLYSFICKPKKAKREYISMAIREDIRKLDRYIAQLDFIYKHEIGDKGSIEDKKANFVSELRHLLSERRRLNTEKERAIRHHDGALINAKTAEIGEISKRIRELRKQIKMCDELYIDSDKVMEKAYAEIAKREKQSSILSHTIPNQQKEINTRRNNNGS